MQSPESRAIIAAAGSAKTQMILDEVLAHPDRTSLITTFTVENLGQIERRLARANGGVRPRHVTVLSWFSFLVNQCVRPYQRTIFNEANFVAGFNFTGHRSRYTPKKSPVKYFLDQTRNVYRDAAAHLACEVDTKSGGLATARLSEMFDDIYIDELQDLNGYDLEYLDQLLASPVRLTAVGDPRQHTFSTNQSMKNRKFKGEGLMNWLGARSELCSLEIRNKCYRSNQTICDLADSLYPDMPGTVSINEIQTDHDGIFRVAPADVATYYEEFKPTVLRYNRNTDTMGLPAMNVGLSKGCTYARVLIFPTKTWRKFLAGRSQAVTSKEKLYVAITRARYSVAWVDV